MNDLDKLIKAIKLRDVNQVSTILDQNGELVHERDETGATALHYATFEGLREIVQLLLDRGAEINSQDSQFGATPTGWAIEYLRERGGFLHFAMPEISTESRFND
jgi:ankyrin repeat protein